MTTLADFPSRQNSLNFVRLALAALVIVSHAWPIGGFGNEPTFGGFTLGHLAVAGFFAVSGWLITQSRMGSELPSYVWRRFVRIYPAFLVALVVVGFGFAPVGAVIAGTPYTLGDGAWYVAANAAMYIRSWTVGSTLPTTAFQAWNGSLWTLFYEVSCYAVLGFLVTVVGRRQVTVSVAALSAGTTVVEILIPQTVLPGPAADFIDLAPFFFAGALLYQLRSRIPLSSALAAVGLTWLVAVVVVGLPSITVSVPIAYLALWIGRTLPARLGRTNDISYGMYVYAFPVQQLVALAGGASLGIAPYVLVCVAGTVPFAAASWFCVEQPALRSKRLFDRFPLIRSGTTIRRRPHTATA